MCCIVNIYKLTQRVKEQNAVTHSNQPKLFFQSFDLEKYLIDGAGFLPIAPNAPNAY